MATRNWDSFHRRGAVLRAVIEEADARLDGSLPTDLPGVADAFPDDLALIAALQLRWHTRLSGRIEQALVDLPSDLETAVLTGWRNTAADLPGIRAILDAYAERPTSEEMRRALETSQRKDGVLMASMAGRASPADAGAAGIGRRMEEQARMAYTLTPRLRGQQRHRRGCPSQSLVERIKAGIGAA
jgi:hypothetical protein